MEKIHRLVHWTKKKIRVELKESGRIFFHEREIWFAHVGANIGYEQDGKGEDFLRPVLVIKKYNKDLCTVLCLTSKAKVGRYYENIIYEDSSQATVILSQIRTISSNRLLYKKGTIPKEKFRDIQKRLSESLNLL